MLSAHKLLSTLKEMKQISQLEFALFQSNGKVVVYTQEMNEIDGVIEEFLDSAELEQTYGKYQLYKINIENETEYVLVTYGEVDNGVVIGRIATSQVRTLILSKSEEFDRNVFIQNVLLGNMLAIDMYSKAKK